MKKRRYNKYGMATNQVAEDVPRPKNANPAEQWHRARSEGKREGVREQRRNCRIWVILAAAVAVALTLLAVWII